MTEDIIIKSIQKLELKEGDILVVETKNVESLQEIFNEIKERYPKLKELLDSVVVITADEPVVMKVIRKVE